MRRGLGVVGALLGVVAVTGWAQEEAPAYRQVASPYHEEIAYRIGGEAAPRVEIDRLRWEVLSVKPKEGKEIVSGKAIPTTIGLRFSNRADRRAEAVVILLFEDDQRNPLGRVELDPVRVAGGETRESRHKVKLQGDVIRATTRVYLFCEVRR